jgi:ABC-type transporter Mla MlaB component
MMNRSGVPEYLRMMVMELMRDGVSLNQVDTDQVDFGTESGHHEGYRTAQTIVLQPADLTGVEGNVFQDSFAQALQNAAVILVDLIWLDQIDRPGLNVLLDVMRRSEAAGKTVSFLSMDAHTRQWLDDQWERENPPLTVGRDDVFAPDFEQFLADCQARKEATLLAVEIASTRQW